SLWGGILVPQIYISSKLNFNLFGLLSAFRAHRDIGLELGFGARGPNHHRTVALQQILEYIRLGKTVQALGVVQGLFDFFAGKGIHLLTRADFLMEGLHDALHLGETGAAIEFIAVEGVQAVAVGLVQLIQLIQQANALDGVVAEHLADQVSAVDTVLIADVAAGQVAVALFETEDIAVSLALLLQQADL